jgi:predicted nucleotidyltransferase
MLAGEADLFLWLGPQHRRHVPNPCGLVPRGGDRLCAVGGESGRSYRLLVALEGGELHSGSGIPEPRSVVVTGRDHTRAVAGEGGRSNRLLVALECGECRTSPGIPNPRRTVVRVRGRNQPYPVGGEGACGDQVLVPLEPLAPNSCRMDRTHRPRDRCRAVPFSGTLVPIMGTRRDVTSHSQGLVDALFSSVQQRVLGLVFGQPDRSFYTKELIHLVRAGSGAVQRELARLEQSGLVTARRSGAQKHYQANSDSLLFSELCSIVRKTLGLAGPIRQALSTLEPDISAAFVYGSVPRHKDTAASDVDLMVLSDTLTYSQIVGALDVLGTQLGRPVHPTMYSQADWATRVKEGNVFVTRVLRQPKLWIIGGESDLPA